LKKEDSVFLFKEIWSEPWTAEITIDKMVTRRVMLMGKGQAGK
jgi:hypothetical protein